MSGRRTEAAREPTAHLGAVRRVSLAATGGWTTACGPAADDARWVRQAGPVAAFESPARRQRNGYTAARSGTGRSVDRRNYS